MVDVFQSPRVFSHSGWSQATLRWWDGTKWVGDSGDVAPAPSVYGEYISQWVKDPSKVLASRSMGPGDDFSAVVSGALTEASEKRSGVLSPQRHRVRIFLSPGVYRSQFSIPRAYSGMIGVEVVGSTGDPDDVVIDPSDLTKSAVEHSGVTSLWSGVTVRRPAEAQAQFCFHGSGLNDVAHELIIHNSKLLYVAGKQCFSHEAGGAHTLYICDSTLVGDVYMHTMQPGIKPNVSILDNVVSDFGFFYDESTTGGATVILRSGWSSSPTYTTRYQRTGSASSPTVKVVIDPDSGIKSSSSSLVSWAVDDLTRYPVLDKNPVMSTYYGGI